MLPVISTGHSLEAGAYGNGVVYKLTPSGSGWTESVLYDFPNFSDGSPPLLTVWTYLRSPSAIFYGTTEYGG